MCNKTLQYAIIVWELEDLFVNKLIKIAMDIFWTIYLEWLEKKKTYFYLFKIKIFVFSQNKLSRENM